MIKLYLGGNAMPLSIKNEQTEELARKLSAMTGESITVAIRVSLEERVERLARARSGRGTLADDLRSIAARCSALPVVSTLSDEEVLGYDSTGAPSR